MAEAKQVLGVLLTRATWRDVGYAAALVAVLIATAYIFGPQLGGVLFPLIATPFMVRWWNSRQGGQAS